MEGTPFETFAALALCLGVSLGMVWAALGKKALELRQPRRRCPSCGVVRAARRCSCPA